jgi:hypothetical protein
LHPGELFCVRGFIVANLSRPAKRVVPLYNEPGTCQKCIKKGKGAMDMVACLTLAANGVRLQLHALTYYLGNFLRTIRDQSRSNSGR